VGALEIGDPKMDSGLLLPESQRKPNYDFERILSYGEVLNVMDQHINYLMEWHTGMPLAQTLLSSQYIDAFLKYHNSPLHEIKYPVTAPSGEVGAVKARREFIQDVLRCFCIITAKSCGMAIDLIRNCQAPFYEDEDISLQTLGRDLFPNVEIEDIQDMCNNLENQISWLESVATEAREVEALKSINARMILVRELMMLVNTNAPLSARLAIPGHINKLLRYISKETPQDVTVKGVFNPGIQHRIASTSPMRPLPAFDAAKSFCTVSKIAQGLSMVAVNRSREFTKPAPNMQLLKVCSITFCAISRAFSSPKHAPQCRFCPMNVLPLP
jgi:hypothetical protein